MNMKLILVSAALAFAAPATAKDVDTCGSGMVCASNPATIIQALQRTGVKATLVKDDGGDPMIKVVANTYDYDVLFYDCENGGQCGAIQFSITFSRDGNETPALANEFNLANRMGKAYLEKDGRFTMRYDLSTMGGLTAKNFADVIGWWEQTLKQLGDFWKAHPAAKK